MWKGVKKISASAMAAILVAMSVPMAAFADSASDDTSGGGLSSRQLIRDPQVR